MGKWLAAGGVGLVVLLLLLWRQLDAPPATAAPPQAKVAPPASPSPSYDALEQAKKIAAEEHDKAGVVEPPPVVPSPDGKPAKIDVKSDEFFYKFQEVVPAVLSRRAVICYEGRPDSQRLKMNAKLTLQFKIKIKDGEVTVNNVHASADTLNDAALSACFTQAVQRASWHDDTLPDWEAEDELLIRPERGLKKYRRDNIEYVGAEAPRADEPVIRPNQ
ncbi:MAG: hypothetical protein IPQ07_05420 [Myxococcales bacterium]|nr:hypothetical protein [Myxococcales bacterium]